MERTGCDNKWREKNYYEPAPGRHEKSKDRRRKRPAIVGKKLGGNIKSGSGQRS
jgi:ribosomal protein S21